MVIRKYYKLTEMSSLSHAMITAPHFPYRVQCDIIHQSTYRLCCEMSSYYVSSLHYRYYLLLLVSYHPSSQSPWLPLTDHLESFCRTVAVPTAPDALRCPDLLARPMTTGYGTIVIKWSDHQD